MKTLRPALNDIYAPIEKELSRFVARFRKELASDDAFIHEIHQHLLKMTGKFLRPGLTLLSSKANGRESAEAVELAVAIELIHTATLVHDDIIDDSELRRSQPSVYYKWGREISIVSGDYLYAKAFVILAGLKDVWVNQAFAACAHVICEGEMKQIEKRNHFLMSEEDYLKIIHQKTAALFQAACMGGAYFARSGEGVVRKMGDYGHGLGMAFQIVDDCLDLTGETVNLGKTAGLDIYKNEVTLPLLYLFQALNAAEKKELLSELQDGRPALIEKVRKLAHEREAVEKAMDKARDYIEKAIQDLSVLKSSPAKESLIQLAKHCLERVR